MRRCSTRRSTRLHPALRPISRRVLPIVSLLSAALLVGLGACSTDTQGDVSEPRARLSASASGTVRIECSTGSVEVVGAHSAQVLVEGSASPKIDLVARRTGHTTHIICVQPSVLGTGAASDPFSPRADLEITVPRASRLEIEGAATDVTVRDVAGEIEVTTITGAVRLDGAARSAEVATVSGAVDVTLDSSRIDVRTVDGAIDCRGAVDDLTLTSASAPITVHGTVGEIVRLASATGTSTLEQVPADGVRVECEGLLGACRLPGLPPTEGRKVLLEARDGALHPILGDWDAADGELDPLDQSPPGLL